jgi:hypothetical protein
MKERNNNMSLGFCEILSLIFIVLKLTGFISWSWFWVLFPIILVFVIAATLYAILYFISNYL